MTPAISIVYSTCRAEPHLEWFAKTLLRECPPVAGWELIVVDRLQGQRDLGAEEVCVSVHTLPKPTPWQGAYRHVKLDRDYFAASNARNTGICFARGAYVVFVDDLSALMPGWWDGVRHAADHHYAMAGRYEKVRNLAVAENGTISSDYLPGGHDSREARGSKQGIVPCGEGEMFGCCLGVPLETLLSVNGWDECADGIGFEDALLGKRLWKSGTRLFYNYNVKVMEDAFWHYPPHNESLPRANRAIKGYQDLNWEMLSYTGVKARGTDYDLVKVREAVLKEGYAAFPTDVKPFRFPDGECAVVGL